MQYTDKRRKENEERMSVRKLLTVPALAGLFLILVGGFPATADKCGSKFRAPLPSCVIGSTSRFGDYPILFANFRSYCSSGIKIRANIEHKFDRMADLYAGGRIDDWSLGVIGVEQVTFWRCTRCTAGDACE